MKATGIVRRIDDLGRIVIPKEIRRTNHLQEGSPLEIYTDKEGEIILKKYSPIAELGETARQLTDVLGQNLSTNVCIADRDKMIAASQKVRKEYLGKEISKELENLIQNRLTVSSQSNGLIPLLEEEDKAEGYKSQSIYPIIASGDAIGAVILFGKETKDRFSDSDYKITACIAAFLGKQMEE